jgi:transposase
MNETNKPRRRFDETFKREAVGLLLQGGKSAKELARDLGVSSWNLRDWKERYGPPSVPTVPRSPAALEAENRQLRREIETLRLQRDILKKTLGILSPPPSSGLNA